MKRLAVALILAASLSACGCSAATWQGVAAGMAAAGSSASPSAGDAKLMLFGGVNHKTYLGCVSCNEYDSDSIFNEYGLHGSSYAIESISNHYSEFGSKYSLYGACNEYATDPPVIVDANGQFYGRLTLNRYYPQITRNAALLTWLAARCEP